MTSTRPMHRAERPSRPEAETHLYSVGQAVCVKAGFGTVLKKNEIFHITATLPARENTLQYRIRSDEERYERVAMQDDLEPAETSRPREGANLIERTFGHG